ncbi:hypothetical protein Purlil1_3352 [Purpureocillium lilacinum]|uniref:Uncharacterized protein n=1 Tax=Purpureocillium lilacinum TaxID=33203 RepID=A0ABR0C6T9_PURLI|nr:hypothetical protein Purlil1_3352 [Purpureocillium lilacinum]
MTDGPLAAEHHAVKKDVELLALGATTRLRDFAEAWRWVGRSLSIAHATLDSNPWSPDRFCLSLPSCRNALCRTAGYLKRRVNLARLRESNQRRRGPVASVRPGMSWHGTVPRSDLTFLTPRGHRNGSADGDDSRLRLEELCWPPEASMSRAVQAAETKTEDREGHEPRFVPQRAQPCHLPPGDRLVQKPALVRETLNLPLCITSDTGPGGAQGIGTIAAARGPAPGFAQTTNRRCEDGKCPGWCGTVPYGRGRGGKRTQEKKHRHGRTRRDSAGQEPRGDVPSPRAAFFDAQSSIALQPPVESYTSAAVGRSRCLASLCHLLVNPASSGLDDGNKQTNRQASKQQDASLSLREQARFHFPPPGAFACGTVEAKQLSRSTNEAAGGGGGGGAAAALGVPADLLHFSASACRDTTVHRLASWLALASAQSTAHHVHAACHSDAADYVIVMAGRRRRAMDEADAASAGR